MDKRNVEVIAHYNLNGEITPLKIRLIEENDEKAYMIDKPSKPVKGSSLKIGLQGKRYSCFIDGKKAYLFLSDENKWYIEPT
ncbi:hypothetical protein [Acetivibrio cellulolyticus]|uniref:hypothetical protein n=1 Tax=Acetivibrio cellulolyticus TaxID=35830 RepID=UPI0001E2C7A4|nr:hypothetical protein [Acetivibrio cellulolyticus]